jgi:exopolysaccharide biosynthesis polyprenyl glycosylphosphotransferase
MKNRFKKIILLLGDLALFYFSLYLALWLRYLEIPNQEIWFKHFTPFSILILSWFIIFYVSGLYDLSFLKNKKILRKTINCFLASSLISVIFFYLIEQSNISPKTNLLIFSIVYFFIFSIWRRIYYWTLKSYLPQNNTAIIGLNSQVKDLVEEIKSKSYLGYNIRFIINTEEKDNNYIGDTPVFNEMNNLASLIEKKKINTIILPTDIRTSQKVRSTLFSCLHLKINFFTLSQFYENLTGKIPIDTINQMWFLENLNEGRKNWFDKFKKLYDLFLSIILLTISSPIWLIIMIFIKIDSKGEVFFTQRRVGLNNKNFTIIKFRTMKIEGNDHSLTQEKDNRITRVGAFLRKTRLDELPQIINIIKGEMSFVGPRPERPEFVEKLEKEIPFYNERMLVKPGITGWDQISGEYHSPTTEDSLKKLQYDLFYIKNRSVYLDLSIVLKTIATVFSKTGR